MYVFWDLIIKDVLEALKPQSIIEIGSDTGLLTEKLLNYCMNNNARLHAIDPVLKYDFNQLNGKYQSTGIYYKDTSLRILPNFKNTDLVLIDGDHNWYTVFNELSQLLKISTKANQTFPFTLLHDTIWPYGRRDLYYNPDSIPEKFRHPYEQKGILVGKDELSLGGINNHLFNAVHVGGKRNGVLTAIEDFVKNNPELEFINIPFYHGLGFLFDKKRLTPELEKIIRRIADLLTHRDKINLLESERLNSQVKNHNLKRSLNDVLSLLETNDEFFLFKKHNEAIAQILSGAKETDVLIKLDSETSDKTDFAPDTLVKRKEELLNDFIQLNNDNLNIKRNEEAKIKEIQELKTEISGLLSENEQLINHLEEAQRKNKSFEKESGNLLNSVKQLEQVNSDLVASNSNLERALNKIEVTVLNYQQTIKELEKKNKRKGDFIKKLDLELEDQQKKRNKTIEEKKEILGKYTQVWDSKLQLENEHSNLLSRYNLIKSKNNELIHFTEQIQSQYFKLENSSKLITTEFQAFKNSWRWIIGNSFVRLAERILLRKKIELATDRIQSELDYIKQIQQPTKFNKLKSESKLSNIIKSESRTGVVHYEFSIVITVHNALEDLQRCLQSVVKSSSLKHEVILVNDFSDSATTYFLENFTNERENFTLINNSKNEGYTVSLNRGIKEAKGKLLVLLNSDTIVPNNWLQRLKETFETDENIGIIGPLSNAATWQSIPKVYDENGWIVNEMPESTDLEITNKILDQITIRKYCYTTLLNGFCLAIKKDVVDKIGLFDEEAFPIGYGEENDFCIRSSRAGFKHVVLKNLYVFHAKSKSFGTKNRKILSTRANTNLHHKYGVGLIKELVNELKTNEDLVNHRRTFEAFIAKRKKLTDSISKPRVLFLLPVTSGSGGGHSVVQECYGMNQLGCKSKVAIKRKHTHHYQKLYPKFYAEGLFEPFSGADELNRISTKYNVLVATIFTSVKMLEKVYHKSKHFIPAYYIQDYEPLFFNPKTDKSYFKEAKESYTRIENLVLFAKTDWLVKMVEEKHSVKVHKVKPSIDREVYFASKNHLDTYNPIVLTAMVRPKTPRRGPERTMDYLEKLKQKYKENIDIHIFGVDPMDPFFHPKKWNFDYCKHGILIREEVAKLLRLSDVFVDLSDYQAFGRTGLEAMACGCATILPQKGGIYEYAIDQENCILVNTKSMRECIEKSNILFSNIDFLNTLKKKGIQKSLDYNILEASISELMLFQNQLNIKTRMK